MAHPERWDALSPRQKVKYGNLTKWWLAPAYFVICYIRKLGFLDGYAGLRFALFKAWYFALIRKQLHMGWDAFIQADMESESQLMHVRSGG